MRIAITLSLALALFMTASPSGAADGAVEYLLGGTAVAKNAGEPATVDDGAVVCSSAGPSLGGGCLPFGDHDSGVFVHDDVAGAEVAFQVCIDNNGDGLCGGGGGGGGALDPCGDDQFFSHSDEGRFFNPLGPLPTSFRAGCPGGPHAGYVVFLCVGAHNAADAAGQSTPHSHGATKGVITTTIGGTGFGDFCAPRSPAQTKAYTVA